MSLHVTWTLPGKRRRSLLRGHAAAFTCPAGAHTRAAHPAIRSSRRSRCRHHCLSCLPRSPCYTCLHAPCRCWHCTPRTSGPAIDHRGQSSGRSRGQSTSPPSAAVPLLRPALFSRSGDHMPATRNCSSDDPLTTGYENINI